MNNVLHIYTRVSTNSQEEEGTSLETQFELGVQRAEKLGMSYGQWNEGGRSSSKDDLSNRPILFNLLEGMDLGNIEHLYARNTYRLFRNIKTWGMIRLKIASDSLIN